MLDHGVAMNLVSNYDLLLYAETVLDLLSDLNNGLLGLRLAQPHRQLVSLGPDVDNGPVDHDALTLEGLSDQAQNHFQPEIV